MLMLFLAVLLNAGISYWNARVCGQVWDEAKALGGWLRLMVWCGVIQSAIGFSSVLLLALAGTAYGLDWLPMAYIRRAADLWYVLIVVPILLSGWLITIHSWMALARERSLANLATTSWNTFASLKNTYDAFEDMGGALGGVGELLSDLDGDSAPAALALLALALALSSLLGGVLLTWLIVRRHRGTLELPALRRKSMA